MKDLKGLTIRGGVAKIFAQAANVLLRIGSLMILARLLTPTDFGLVGMVIVITGVLSLFKEFGLSAATVQRATISSEQTSTLFWINVLVGAVLGLVCIGIAPFVADFYHEPRLSPVMVVLASGFLFNAAGVQHSALLQRQMRFTALALIDVVSLLMSSAVSIVMAFRGYGYWALVAWSVTLPLAATLLTWLQSGWIPGRPRREPGIRVMMRFGGTLTLNSLVCYVAYNLDKLLLGRVWGPEVIGLYGRAYQLTTLPTDNFNAAVGGVGFPVLSRLQDDPPRLRSYFLKAYSFIVAMIVPVTVVSALFAPELILAALGPKWKEAVPLFQLLTPTILILALINPPGWFLLALGMVGRSLRLGLAILVLMTMSYVIGLPYGPKGVAFGYTAAMTLWVVPHLLWCFHGTVVSFRDVVLVVSRPLVSGIVAGSGAFAVLFLFAPASSPFVRLLLGGTVLAALYAWMLLFVMGQKNFYMDLFHGWRKEKAVSLKPANEVV